MSPVSSFKRACCFDVMGLLCGFNEALREDLVQIDPRPALRAQMGLFGEAWKCGHPVRH
jgi:hypothetical protein